MKLDDVVRLVTPLARRVANLVSRAIVRKVDDAKKVQELQLDVLDGETRDEIERFQEYGFTSVPLDGAEAVVVFVGGRREHGLAIGVEDRRYRIGNLASGETAVYNHTGAKIVFKANGDIEATPKPGQKLSISGPVEINGDVTITGDVDSSGTVTASNDVVGGGKSLATHTHSATLNLVGTTATAGSPLVGTATGSTGAPS
jgi:phage baseplate assembly protein V